MIKKLSVKNFKSIEDLEINCRKINLFIGEPNTGKSNILEALGLLSWYSHWRQDVHLREYVRFQEMQNLFYDNSLDRPVSIKTVEGDLEPSRKSLVERGIQIQFRSEEEAFSFSLSIGDSSHSSLTLDYSGRPPDGFSISDSNFSFVKFYRFERQDVFQGRESSFLMPPHGSNMFTVVMGSKKLRASMARFFNDLGFRLVLRPQARAFESQKQMEDESVDVVFNYPYVSISDTLQRVVFYSIAIESNRNATLILEEPESHAFPYYTKFLGEKIALDESNQYFIATHNPYLLLSILEKAPKNDVSVFITYFRDYQTRVKCLDDEETSELMSYDPFANLDIFVEPLYQIWSDLLKNIKKKRLPALHAFLTEASPMSIEDSSFVIYFDPKFTLHREHVQEAKSKKVIEAELSELMGRPMSLKIIEE
ncbi:AAA family ATPase [Candidatus Poribacteria bacterium]